MKLYIFAIITLFFECFTSSLYTQEFVKSSHFSRQSQVYFSWGYNRSQYSRSDIHVKGSGYDFTLFDVAAYDRPSDFSVSLFLDPTNISIPQFNFRIGYYLNDRLSVSVGFDHMKYVVKQLQDVLISGKIDSLTSFKFAGSYSNAHIKVRSDFFEFEHTNGLNYFNIEGDYLLPLYKSKSEKFRIHLELGLGLGFLMPKSDVTFFGVDGINEFQIAGYGLDFNTGFRFDLGKHFFLRSCVKGGFINLPAILTYEAENTYAQQHFFFLQEYATLSYAFLLKNSATLNK